MVSRVLSIQKALYFKSIGTASTQLGFHMEGKHLRERMAAWRYRDD
jgi:hypothetical protein